MTTPFRGAGASPRTSTVAPKDAFSCKDSDTASGPLLRVLMSAVFTSIKLTVGSRLTALWSHRPNDGDRESNGQLV